MAENNRKDTKAIAALTIVIVTVAACLIIAPKLKSAAGTNAPAPVTAAAEISIAPNPFGITTEEAASIQTLVLAGDRREEIGENGSFYDALYEEWDNDRRIWMRQEDGQEVEKGSCGDLSFLAGLPNLQNLILINQSAAELPDLSGLTQLRSIELLECDFESLEGLRHCNSLVWVRLSLDRVTDFSPLSGSASLRQLQLETRGSLDLGFVSSLPKLTSLDCWCSACENTDALSACTALNRFRLSLTGERARVDLSGLKGRKLTELRLDNVDTDLGFLKGLSKMTLLEFCGSLDSWSGLNSLSYINELYYDARGDDADELLAALAGVEVKNLWLYGCRSIDLSQIPAKTSFLSLDSCRVDSLEGLRGRSLKGLELKNLSRLQSLKGLESLKKLESLSCSLCLHLSEWDAVYGKELTELSVTGQYILPDLSQISFQKYGRLCLESIPGLTNADVLDSLPEKTKRDSTFSLSLCGEELSDLTVLEGFKMNTLTVSPVLEEDARALVQRGCFSKYEVSDSGELNEDIFADFALLSMDELDTLPDAVLAKVRKLYVGGDEVYTDGSFEWNGQIEDCRYMFRSDWGFSEDALVSLGSFRDLKAFSKLTGLEELVLVNEPLESLEGIQSMPQLCRLKLIGCDIEDISPLSALSLLEELQLEHCAFLTSIEGVQDLPCFRRLDVFGTPIRDFTPLTELRSTASVGFELSLSGYDPFCRLDDYSFLSSIPNLQHLEMHGCPAEDWMDCLPGGENSHLHSAFLFSCFDSAEQFERFIDMHPGIVDLVIENNPSITDLKCLLNCKDLYWVRISEDMEEAFFSLEETGYSFILDFSD